MTPRSRTLASTLTSLPLIVGAALAFAIPAMTHDAPLAGSTHSDSPAAHAMLQDTADSKPLNWPTWETHGGAVGCQPVEKGELVDVVLVVTQGGDVERMPFDAAWALSQDAEPANDVWTIGAC